MGTARHPIFIFNFLGEATGVGDQMINGNRAIGRAPDPLPTLLGASVVTSVKHTAVRALRF